MSEQLKESIVRFYDAGGAIVGAGFLVSEKILLTCAHVVAKALGVSQDCLDLPNGEVQLDFPLVAPEKTLSARVIEWRPAHPGNGIREDVAALILIGVPPNGSCSARLTTAGGLWGHGFRAFGFPAGYDTGVWASGVFRERQADGWVQIEDVKQSGYLVEPGFSGAPVWDEEVKGIVGMIVAAERRTHVKAAFVVPVTRLVKVLPDLAEGPMSPAQGPADSLKRYYQQCIGRQSQPRYALDRRFVQLTLLLDQGEDLEDLEGPRWQASKQFQDLREVLDQVPEPVVVVLGRPGFGKSSLLRHYELDCAREALSSGADESPLTFFLPLNSYKPARAGDPLPLPKDWLAERWRVFVPDLPPLETLLRQSRMTLLLDALNEIPADRAEVIRQWKDYLRELAQDYPGNRVIFSCRSLDYSASLSSKDLPVPQVRIQPLSDEQLQQFIEVYCPEHSTTLWRNLKDTPQLGLLRSPYFLKLLVKQTQEGEVPEGRVALFTGFVRAALKREVESDNPLFQPGELLHNRDIQRLNQATSWKTSFELPERGVLIHKLSQLAYQMQRQQSEGEGGQVRIDYGEALGLLNHVRSKDLLDAGSALGVLEQDPDSDEVLYFHQLLQEYFAARELARTPQPELVRQAWQSDKVTPRLEDTLAKLASSDPLPPLPSTGWEETTVLAAAMAPNPAQFIAQLMETNLPLAGRCAAQPEVRRCEAMKDVMRQDLIIRTQDPEADLRARIAAGEALGHLGDPRFKRCRGPAGDYLLPPLVEIPGGTYSIVRYEPFKSYEAFRNAIGVNFSTLTVAEFSEKYNQGEASIQSVMVKPFAIGRFLVTNAEWRLFMAAGAYEDERWWDTEASRAWLHGEGPEEEAREGWRMLRRSLQGEDLAIQSLGSSQNVSKARHKVLAWIIVSPDDAFEELLNIWYPPGRKTEPAFWYAEDFNSPAQPVVGISWFEARAYCAWLSAHTNQVFRLPTEVEWEVAARGKQDQSSLRADRFDAVRAWLSAKTRRLFRRPTGIDGPAVLRGKYGRRYGWGDDKFNLTCCNTYESHIWHTTPIGIFPHSDTRERLSDVIGNVWEWTTTPSGYHKSVLGGSWFDAKAVACVNTPWSYHPCDRHPELGFRMVCSSLAS